MTNQRHRKLALDKSQESVYNMDANTGSDQLRAAGFLMPCHIIKMSRNSQAIACAGVIESLSRVGRSVWLKTVSLVQAIAFCTIGTQAMTNGATKNE